jgi:hypothetical protein
MSSERLNKTNEKKSLFEDAFHEALKKFGYLFPETEEELKQLKEKLSKTKIEVPDDLNYSMKILQRGKITYLSEFNSSEDVEIEENLAIAAREGSEISDETFEQMEKDRREAEEKAKEKNANKF